MGAKDSGFGPKGQENNGALKDMKSCLTPTMVSGQGKGKEAQDSLEEEKTQKRR